eukprot:scaffold34366_cov23-Cyclotella_meneghiniana.AAC.1
MQSEGAPPAQLVAASHGRCYCKCVSLNFGGVCKINKMHIKTPPRNKPEGERARSRWKSHGGCKDGKVNGWLLGWDGGWLGAWMIPDGWLSAWLRVTAGKDRTRLRYWPCLGLIEVTRR